MKQDKIIKLLQDSGLTQKQSEAIYEAILEVTIEDDY